MAAMPDGAAVRRVMLEAIAAHADRLQSGTILSETAAHLKAEYGQYPSEAILTSFYDLFRTGQLSWGYNLSNPDPPFCHLTDHGRRMLEHLSRDPANPDGYLAHLQNVVALSPTTGAYVREALVTYNSDCVRASAVMIGGAAEASVLELRDALQARLEVLGRPIPAGLRDWRAKRVLDAVHDLLASQKTAIPQGLREAFDAYWPAFSHLIRTARNDAGHPSDLTTITPETVHAALLVFPELASLSKRLETWVTASFA